MWNPPIELTPEEQNMAARTRKTRKFFVLLRARRHARLAADFQHTLAESDSPEPGGKAPVDAGWLALATRWQAYGPVGERDAVELTGMAKRWQRVLDGRGAEPPPCSRGTLCNLRLRLIAHNLDTTLRDRTGAVAETTGGCGARQRRAVLDATPLCGAGRGEDTLPLLGHALRKAVGLAAQALGTSPAALVEEAGLGLGGHRRLTAALDLDGGEPTARQSALRGVLAAVARWTSGLAPPPTLLAPQPPLQERRDTRGQMVEPDPEPDPEGGLDGRRITQHVAPARRLSIEDQARRHGRTRRAKTCTGGKEHVAGDLDSHGTREGGVRPATEPESAAVERLAAAWEKRPGGLPLESDLGDRASPRMAPWAAQGGHIMARPWPCGGPLFTTHDFPFDCAHGHVTWPQGQTVLLVPGRDAQCPASACDTCPLRTQGTTARLGHGRRLTMREDAPCQHKLRATMQTKRGRASRRKRTAVAPALAHQWAPQGRRARAKGRRKNPCDGRRHAAVSNLLVAARYEEERQLAS